MTHYVLNSIIPNIQIPNNVRAISSMGQSYNVSVSQQSVSRAIMEVAEAIVNVLGPRWIKFPVTRNEKNIIKARFMEAVNFPGTIGAMDCTHVAILAPVQEEHNYINRHGSHSKNVQLVCDYDLKILNINARYAGATHDAYIFRNSVINRELERCYNLGDQNTWFIGDSGYPQLPWVMTPVLHALPDTPEFRYNEAHIRAQNCIERCNAVLKGRRLDPDFEIPDLQRNNIVNAQIPPNNYANIDGRNARDVFINQYFT
ncbi:hypothetical protein NQ315_002700 [Exocentrus adspersus]|uniref:DDE Tnp4 domain-containing protein n=1 Tax=Exocentrus adspersus TaxID=1586481 RepID=A0AAV8VHY7_9CUCU|nr:hypothetical protein NQ315_002700 [Exocentrus adspersus]